ncbi:IclR family transcriptional regulator [Brevibacillus fulvus]|uniref:DNA-binding IclR family transcriptional regulator n=1 Tax=Brevibacillus fulvus TaxID=1125967 RepID=A0A939BR03_9BACL|nr:IclR family transcriptional regulator [Brevibacillus fulvus]MBM7588963.1 DNA-binding IclR family transcriptional regulator [Brevibacillus fulvus]
MAANEEKRMLSSLSNALRILRSYSLEKPSQGITEIAASLQLGKSTVHRLVSTLVSEGFLVKDEKTKKYRLGYSVLALSGVITSTLDIYTESLPIIRKLVDHVGETAHIAILDGCEVIYVMKIECNHHVRFLTHVGRRNPLHCTSSGKVLLAHQEPAFFDRLLQKGLVKHSHNTITDPVALREHLQKIKENGYATSYEELLEGVHSIAAPIRDYTGQVIAAVTIVGPKQRLTRAKIPFLVKKVKEASREISEKMGYYRRKHGY